MEAGRGWTFLWRVHVASGLYTPSDPPISITFVHGLRATFDLHKFLSSFVLVDLVIHKPYTHRWGGLRRLVLGALTRRDR